MFAAPDREAAEALATVMVTPALGGELFDWEVVETRELLTLDEQAQGLLADASEDDEAEEGADG